MTYPSQPDEALRPVPSADTDRIRAILRRAADRLEATNRHTAMSEQTRFLQIQLAVWDHHGRYNGPTVGRDIVDTLNAVRDLPLHGTRAEYSVRLRLALGAVVL